MPMPLLGAADSFNSSGATIVPDKRGSQTESLSLSSVHQISSNQTRTRTQNQNHNQNRNRFYPGQDNTSPRALVSQDSLEGHINSALRVGGDDGMIGILQTQTQDMGGNGLSGLSFMREFESHPLPQTQTQPQVQDQPPMTSSFPPAENAPSSFEPGPSTSYQFDPSNFIGHVPINPAPSPFQYNSAYRPPSAHSLHSSRSSVVDPSDYYSTTDMDTDDDDLSSVNDIPGLAVRSNVGDLGMGDMDLTGRPAVMTWTQYRPAQVAQDGGAGISPSDLNTNVLSPGDLGLNSIPSPAVSTGSRSEAGSSMPKRGSIRGVGGIRPHDERDPSDKLEHRRDINRRSAQKHRARRKEELEEMSRAITQRDARISQLERDLQVEKARNDQLRNLMNARLANGGGGGGAAGLGGFP